MGKTEKKDLVVSATLYMVCAFIEIFFAMILSNIINGATSGDLKQLVGNIIYAILLVGGSLFMYWLAINARRNYVMNNIKNIKAKLMESFYKRGLSCLKENDNSYYLNLITSDLDIVETNYYMQQPIIFFYIGQFVFAVIALIYISWKATVAFILLFFIPLLIPQFLNNKLAFWKKKVSETNEQFMFEIKEQIQGMDTIVCNRSINNYRRNFNRSNVRQQANKKHSGIIENFVRELSSVCGFIAQIGCMGIGGFLVIKGEINVGELIASIQLLNSVFNPINALSEMIAQIKSTKLIRDKIKSELSVEECKQENQGIDNEKDINIVYDNLSVSYDENNIIVDKFSHVFHKGEISVVIGDSGCGKTTIFKCLLDVYNKYKGKISIGGIDIRNISPNEIYKYIGYVPQNVYIFNDTIENNITLGGNYSRKEIDDVISKVCLENLIKNQDGTIGDNGMTISGGEKQRIGLARVLIRNPKVIIFDEPTSALDPDTRDSINNMIFGLEGYTRIVVTHDRREEYLNQFDDIVVIGN